MKELESIARRTEETDTTRAVMLLNRLFTRAELSNPAYNVYGKSMNGSGPKKPLDPSKINLIRSLMLERVPLENKLDCWRRCVSAIHKRMFDLRP